MRADAAARLETFIVTPAVDECAVEVHLEPAIAIVVIKAARVYRAFNGTTRRGGEVPSVL
jgi:hypothetical protein